LLHAVWSTSDGVGVGLSDVEGALLLAAADVDVDEAVGVCDVDSGRDAAAFFGCTVTEHPASAATTATVTAADRTTPARSALVPSPFSCAARREPIRSMTPESIHDHRDVKQTGEDP
jgi:hypothetical protein